MTQDVNAAAVSAKVKAREAAYEVALLAAGEAPADPASATHYWGKLISELKEIAGPFAPVVAATAVRAPAAVAPMTDSQVAQFNRVIVPYGNGKKGKRVEEVSLTWFDWLLKREMDEFKQNVARYLANPKIADELDREIQDEENRRQHQ